MFSVIKSNEEHPDAKPFIEKIQKEYRYVLYDVKLAKGCVIRQDAMPGGVAMISQVR